MIEAIRRAIPICIAITGGIGLTAVLTQPSEVRIAEYSTSLAGRSGSQRHNSELALHRLVGATIGPGETFSFNAHVGTFSRDAGYRRAPVSYNGQLIDSWGGGVCQTSTTLYNAALLAGLKIVERSRHRFAPSYVPPGRDAAVAFSSIDLQLRNPYSFPVTITGSIGGDRLSVAFVGAKSLRERPRVFEIVRETTMPNTYSVGTESARARVRNTGKAGFQVTVFRTCGGTREVISSDSYPSMDRVIEFR